jgi:hypothetical protein
VLPGQAEDMTRLNEIVAAYKRRFKQQSVGMIVRPACVSFKPRGPPPGRIGFVPLAPPQDAS